MSRIASVTISQAALTHNLRRIKHCAGSAKVMSVVKADGYGHGLLDVASALSATHAYAVCHLSEALILREAGFDHPIALLEGCLDSDEFRQAAELRLWPVLHSEHQVLMLERLKLSAPLSVWLKVDAGMHRLGFLPETIRLIYQRVEAIPHVQVQGFMGHFSRADEKDNPTTSQQMATFDKAIEGLPGQRSLANSAAILGWPQSHRDWVRAGIALYGASPFTPPRPEENLLPAMTARAALMAVRQLPGNEPIGYGGTWRTPPEGALIGIVSFGYGDGYPRHAPNGTPVLVNGQRVPLIGRVSMDMLSVNLASQPYAKVGDPVILWGEGLPAAEVAEKVGTIAYELFCRLGNRIERRLSTQSTGLGEHETLMQARRH